MNSHLSKDNSDDGFPIVHLRSQPLPSDVTERISQVFPSASDAVAHRLSQLRSEDPQLFGDRIIRCIVFCTSHYPTVGIDHWIEQARIDYRDLIVAAEYDRADNHLRDLNRPFRDEEFSTTNRNA